MDNIHLFGSTESGFVSVSDADDGLSVSSHSTLDPLPIHRPRRPKRPLAAGGRRQQPEQSGACGKRSKRRQLNDSYLHSLATVTEICEEDVSGVFCCPNSPLSGLFQHPERMLAWQEFVQLGDDEQQRVLGEAPDAEADEADGSFEDCELRAVVLPAQPRPSAGERWRQLSAKCRDFVLRKAAPGTAVGEQLRQFERELRDTFDRDEADCPDWVGGCRPAHERLLLHAVAGFLGLASASENSEGAGRCICVRRRRCQKFLPPSVTLEQFLVRLRLRRERLLAARLALR